MIRINLLPSKEAQRAFNRRQQLAVAGLSLALALLMMVIPYSLHARRLAQLDRDISQLTAEIDRYDSQVREVRDLEHKRAELEAKLKVIDDLKQKRIGPVHILDDLSGAAPEKLWLVDFSDNNGVATITGMALDNQTVADFMTALEKSPYFYEVDLVESAKSESAHGGPGATPMVFEKFIVKAALDYLGGDGKSAPPADGKKAPPGAKTGA